MFGLIASAVGSGLGLLSGRKKDKEAQRANDQSLAMQQNQLAFDQKRYNDAMTQYKPIEDSLLAMAQENVEPDYDGFTTRAIGDVNTQFANGEAANTRSMQRMGINPNSGRADALGRNQALSRSLALVGTINGARRDERYRADNLNWDRKFNIASLGTNKMNGTAASLSNSQTNLTNLYARQASNAQSQSSGLYGAAGQLIGGALSNSDNQATMKEWGNKANGWLSGLGAR